VERLFQARFGIKIEPLPRDLPLHRGRAANASAFFRTVKIFDRIGRLEIFRADCWGRRLVRSWIYLQSFLLKLRRRRRRIGLGIAARWAKVRWCMQIRGSSLYGAGGGG